MFDAGEMVLVWKPGLSGKLEEVGKGLGMSLEKSPSSSFTSYTYTGKSFVLDTF